MADTVVYFYRKDGTKVPVRAVDNGDGTYSLATTATLQAENVNIGDVDIASMPSLPGGNNIVGAFKDAGPDQSVIRTYTPSADMTTAAAITVAPTSGQKVVLTDLLISSDVDMNFALQMETSNNVLAKFYLTAYSPVQISLRGMIKGDAVDKRIFGKASVAGNVAITVVQFSEA